MSPFSDSWACVKGDHRWNQPTPTSSVIPKKEPGSVSSQHIAIQRIWRNSSLRSKPFSLAALAFIQLRRHRFQFIDTPWYILAYTAYYTFTTLHKGGNVTGWGYRKLNPPLYPHHSLVFHLQNSFERSSAPGRRAFWGSIFSKLDLN